MHATADAGEKARMGDAFPGLERTASSGQLVTVPDPAGDFVHLQFRRFAGCPICNLHLRSVVRRYGEIRAAGIREVVVFHSTVAELAKYENELPFPLIADPERQLYQRFGVEHGSGSLLSVRALRAAVAGQAAALAGRSTMRRSWTDQAHRRCLRAAGRFPDRSDGRLAAVKYGKNAYDQWTVDELLEHAQLVPA